MSNIPASISIARKELRTDLDLFLDSKTTAMPYNKRKFNIEAYNKKFDQSIMDSQSQSENEQIKSYTKGLAFYLAREVKYRRPDSLEEAKSIAKVFNDH